MLHKTDVNYKQVDLLVKNFFFFACSSVSDFQRESLYEKQQLTSWITNFMPLQSIPVLMLIENVPDFDWLIELGNVSVFVRPLWDVCVFRNVS